MRGMEETFKKAVIEQVEPSTQRLTLNLSLVRIVVGWRRFRRTVKSLRGTPKLELSFSTMDCNTSADLPWLKDQPKGGTRQICGDGSFLESA